uniref:Uncharacterized protein n=1 Tax=Arundo donax TaxID=35708 RepID=A0A0A9EH37_ARUDO
MVTAGDCGADGEGKAWADSVANSIIGSSESGAGGVGAHSGITTFLVAATSSIPDISPDESRVGGAEADGGGSWMELASAVTASWMVGSKTSVGSLVRSVVVKAGADGAKMLAATV